MLEVIKHFFDVDGVHFILGVNLSELQNSVRARYSETSDAAQYLQKFTSIILPLSGDKKGHQSDFVSDFVSYFCSISEQRGFSHDVRFEWIRDYLSMIDDHILVSLRDMERLITQVMVSPMPAGAGYYGIHL